MNPFNFKEFTDNHLLIVQKMKAVLLSVKSDRVGALRICENEDYYCSECPFSTKNNINGDTCGSNLGVFSISRPSELEKVIDSVLCYYKNSFEYWRV